MQIKEIDERVKFSNWNHYDSYQSTNEGIFEKN